MSGKPFELRSHAVKKTGWDSKVLERLPGHGLFRIPKGFPLDLCRLSRGQRTNLTNKHLNQDSDVATWPGSMWEPELCSPFTVFSLRNSTALWSSRVSMAPFPGSAHWAAITKSCLPTDAFFPMEAEPHTELKCQPSSSLCLYSSPSTPQLQLHGHHSIRSTSVWV